MKQVPCIKAVMTVCAIGFGLAGESALAQPAVNGRLKSEYGPIQWVNTTPTQFGDAPPCVPFAIGVEAALNNSNRAGIPGGASPWAPATAGEMNAAAAVTTGAEFRIPLSLLGGASTIRIAGLVARSDYREASNQFIGGLGGQDSAVSGNNYPDIRTVDLSLVPGDQFVTVSGAAVAGAGPVIDGTLDAAFYGLPLAVQNTRTNYGDASGPTVNPLVAETGSELDAVYARLATVGGQTSLYVFVAGNVQSDNSGGSFKKLVLFLDTGEANGQNRLRDDNNAPITDGGPNAMGGPGTGTEPGMKFDATFSANYFVSITAGDPNSGTFTAFADFAKLGTTAQGGNARSLGSTTTTAAIVSADTCPGASVLRDTASGSEVDGLYAMICGDWLYVLVTGNLQNNGNRLDLFFDVGNADVGTPDTGIVPSTGQNTIRGDNVRIDGNGLNRMGTSLVEPGLRFSDTFSADYWVSFMNENEPPNVNVVAWAGRMNENGAATDGINLLEYGSFTGGPKTANDPISFDGTSCVRFDANPSLVCVVAPGPNDCSPNGLGTLFNASSIIGIDIQGDSSGTSNSLVGCQIGEPYSSFAPRLISKNVYNPFGVAYNGNPAGTNWATPGLLKVTIDNSNRGGVTGSDASRAKTVTTGVEMRIRLDELGYLGSGPIKITGFINGIGHDFVSNQVIGGSLPSGTGNLGEPRTLDFQGSLVAGGPYYVIVTPGTCAGAATGACCFSALDNTCAIMSQAQCTDAKVAGTYKGNGTVCSPNPCGVVPSAGVCCRGTTCNTSVSQALCVSPGAGIGAVYAAGGLGNACNVANNRVAPCCYADFNKTAGVTVQDIFDYLAKWFAGSPYARYAGDGTGGAPTAQSIFDFLAAWFAGPCPAYP